MSVCSDLLAFDRIEQSYSCSTLYLVVTPLHKFNNSTDYNIGNGGVISPFWTVYLIAFFFFCLEFLRDENGLSFTRKA